MEVIETTISEHVFNQGKYVSYDLGKIEGEIRGKIEVIREQIANLESLHQQGVLSKQQSDLMIIPLRQKLTEQLAKIAA
jgi:hypothetical protein